MNMKRAAKITKRMTIGGVVREYPKSVFVFSDFGLYCVGCPAASGETIEEACQSHRINLKEFLSVLNKAIK